MMRLSLQTFLLPCLLLWSAGLPASGEVPRPLPLETLYGAVSLDDPLARVFELSPDGAHLAFTARERGEAGGDASGASRFADGGTPMTALGRRLYLTDRDGRRSIRLCAAELGAANAWRPSWSPDSARLAFYSDAGGAPQLWLYDVGAGRCARVADLPVRARLWGGDEPQWSPDGREVFVPLRPEGLMPPAEAVRASAALIEGAVVEVFCGGSEKSVPGAACTGMRQEADEGQSSNAHYIWENSSDLAAIDIGSGMSRILVPASAGPRPGIARLSPSGKWLTYLSVYYPGPGRQGLSHDLAYVPVSGGKPVLLAGALKVPPRDFYRGTYRWSPVDDTLAWLTPGGVSVVRFGDKGPSAPRLLGGTAGEVGTSLIAFTPDGRSVVVAARPEGRPAALPEMLALVPVDGGAPQFVEPGDGIRIDEPIGPRHGQPGSFPGGALRFRGSDIRSGEALILELAQGAAELRTVWRGAAQIGSVAGGREGEIFATFSDTQTPPDVVRFAPDLQARQPVTAVNPGLAGIDPGTTFVFETAVPTHDGGRKQVRTMVRLPAGMSPGDRPPAIVFIYPNADYSAEGMGFGLSGNPLPAAAFTTRGYAVIYPFVETGPGGEAGNALQEIVDTLLPQLYRAGDLGYVDIDRLAITGTSFGGYSTAGVISRTNLFRAAIAINGIYDLGGNYGALGRRGGDDMQADWTENTQPRIGPGAWSDIARLIENSPYYHARKIHTPLLLLQGRNDVFLTEAQKLFVVLRRLGAPVQLAVYEGSGHAMADWPKRQAVDGTLRAIEFLDRYLR
ncbi:hypothetical protein BBF93_06695 [Hyphomonas sp. CACIAM 19H1]|nr:hypothetical protein BBF93_06695 [Hyphomonas sp. CACIAM 19H1]